MLYRGKVGIWPSRHSVRSDVSGAVGGCDLFSALVTSSERSQDLNPEAVVSSMARLALDAARGSNGCHNGSVFANGSGIIIVGSQRVAVRRRQPWSRDLDLCLGTYALRVIAPRA